MHTNHPIRTTCSIGNCIDGDTEVLLEYCFGFANLSNSANVENFSSGISGIASTTKSASAADVSVEVEIKLLDLLVLESFFLS